MLPQSPRLVGKETSLGTLELAAEVASEQGLTPTRVSGVTIRTTLARLGRRWRRATAWITSPDPAYARKKARRDRLIRLAAAHPDWLWGFEDEVWWSRLAHPARPAWQEAARPLRLLEQAVARDDPDPKALACYGLLTRCWDAQGQRTEDLWLRFVAGRPVSAVTIDFLTWGLARAAERGKRAVLLIWDTASWHDSQIVRSSVRQHNRQVKQTGCGVRLIVCYLPRKSPWLNPMDPTWLPGKRKVLEPPRLLTSAALTERICPLYACPHEPHVLAPPKATRKAA